MQPPAGGMVSVVYAIFAESVVRNPARMHAVERIKTFFRGGSGESPRCL